MRKTRRLAITILIAFIINLFTPNFIAKAELTTMNSNLDMILTLENPVQNHKLTDSFFIKGWALSENGISKVEIYLDNQNVGQATYGIARSDIQSKYLQYSNSLNSGFTKEIIGVSNGNHTLKVVATDTKGVTKETSVTITNDSNKTSIMGNGKATKEQMISLLSKRNPNKEMSYIIDFVEKTITEAKTEGINADILFAQMMHETGYLKFGGDVKEDQNNFAGLGAVGNGAPGESFPSVQVGIRAVVQHLKAYASTEPLNLECVDTRFKYVERGSAKYVEHLGIKENPKGKGWAAHQGYGTYLLSIIDLVQNEVGKYSSSVKSFNVEGEFLTGNPITLSAEGNPSNDTLYKFAYRDDNTGEWIIIQDYSINNRVTYTLNNPGSYRFVVHAKHKLSNEVYDDFDFVDKSIAEQGKITNFNVDGAMINGSNININANAQPTGVLYKFGIRNANGEWITIQDYSTSNSVNYKIQSSGALRVVVHVKNILSNKEYDDFDFKDFNVKDSTKATLDEFNVTGVNKLNQYVYLKAKASPQNETLYKFALRNPKGEWITIQDYATNDNFAYMPKEIGEYRFVVHTKSKGSKAEYEDYGFKDIKITEAKSILKEFTVKGDNYINSIISLKSLAEPNENSLYKYAIRDPKGNWVTIKDYSKISTFEYALKEVGQYRVVVHVKHENSSNDYDEYDFKDIYVDLNKSILNEFKIDGNNYVDHNLSLSAKASPLDKTLYKFGIRTPDGTWITIKEYNNKNSVNFVPKEEGIYRFVVHIKSENSFNEYDEYDFKDILISKSEVKLNSFNINGTLKPNEKISLSASTDKLNETFYKFAVRTPDGKWITIQDYSTNSNFIYTPIIEGAYRIVVHVKHKLSDKEYDDFDFRDVIVRKSKLIVIDAGHNYGGDDGAYVTHGATTYIERDLNMEVAVKLQKELENKGFNVVMTRNPGDRDYTEMRKSLQNRVDLANNLKADFFISIHHNTVGIVPHSATGVEIYYSSAEPINIASYEAIDKMKTINYKIETSQKIGTEMVNSIAKDMNRVNRGLKDDDFYVVKNTTMPSLLVECGFMSNENEAKLLANTNKQQQMAEIMARVIANNL